MRIRAKDPNGYCITEFLETLYDLFANDAEPDQTVRMCLLIYNYTGLQCLNVGYPRATLINTRDSKINLRVK